MKKTVYLIVFFSLLLIGPIICLVGCNENASTITPTTPTLKTCQTCNGAGRYDECATCRGTGKILDTYISNGETEMRIASQEDIAKGNVDRVAGKYRMKHCDVCSGTGTRLCGDCNGRGTLP